MGGAASEEEHPEGGGAQRLDKWLWFARVVKSRTRAAQLIEEGRVRLNRRKAAKASQTLRPGDVVTLALGGQLRILKVLAPGARRGPPAEARLLYAPLSPAGEPAPAGVIHPALQSRQGGPNRTRERARPGKLSEPD